MNFEQQNSHHVVNPNVTSQYHQLFEHGNHHGEVPNMTSFMLHGADHQRSLYHPYMNEVSTRGNPQHMFFAGNPHVGDAPYYIAPPTIGAPEHHGGFGRGKFPHGGSNMRVMHEIEEVWDFIFNIILIFCIF